MLSRIRAGKPSLLDARSLVKRVLVGPINTIVWPDGECPTHLFGKNAAADKINSFKFEELNREGVVQQASFKCTRYWQNEKGERIRASNDMTKVERKLSASVPEILLLRVGARVMVRANNIVQGVYNGMCGTITEMVANKDVVISVGAGNYRTIIRHKYFFVHEKKTLVVEQLPLCLAWAMTIHKSQGLTLNSIVLDLSKFSIFAPYQAYVGLSRARRLEDIYLVNFNMSALISDKTVSEFYDTSSGSDDGVNEEAKDASEIYDVDDLVPKGCEVVPSNDHPNLKLSFAMNLDDDKNVRSTVASLKDATKDTFFTYFDNILLGILSTNRRNHDHGGNITVKPRGEEINVGEILTATSRTIKSMVLDVEGMSESFVSIFLEMYIGSRFIVNLPKDRVLVLTGLSAKYISKITTNTDALYNFLNLTVY